MWKYLQFDLCDWIVIVCLLLGCFAAWVVSWLAKFQCKMSVPFQGPCSPTRFSDCLALEMWPMCPETSLSTSRTCEKMWRICCPETSLRRAARNTAVLDDTSAWAWNVTVDDNDGEILFPVITPFLLIMKTNKM